jgi:hypothetical protein
LSHDKAMALVVEASDLHDMGLRREQSWSVLKGPIEERIRKGVQLAPKDREVLFLATLILHHLGAGFPDLKKLNRDYQKRLDRLGGPTDATLEIAGMSREVYERRRASIKRGR